MRRSHATVVGFAASLILGGCAAGGGPAGPVVSPTGFVYPLGTPPVATRFSQTGTLYLRRDNPQRALYLALEGIESDPENAVHYYLAGTAYARLGVLEEADAMFDQAERIYPAYELEVEPERAAAWAVALNDGLEAFNVGELDAATEAWQRAAHIYDLRPEAHRNLAILFAGEGMYSEAIDVYQRALAGLEKLPATRVLEREALREREERSAGIEESLTRLLLFTNRFAEAEPLLRRRLAREPGNLDAQSDLATTLAGQGRHTEAAEIYTALLSSTTIAATQARNLGVALFRSGDFFGAGQAFKRLTELQPNSRDAWFNFANSLFAAENWDALAAAGDRLVQLDPLSENAGLITARAHLEAGDEDAARRGLGRTDEAPVYLKELKLRPSGAQTTVEGRIVGNRAAPGTAFRLRFTFYSDQGALGSETVTVLAPPAGEDEAFVVAFEGRATAYRYEVLP